MNDIPEGCYPIVLLLRVDYYPEGHPEEGHHGIKVIGQDKCPVCGTPVWMTDSKKRLIEDLERTKLEYSAACNRCLKKEMIENPLKKHENNLSTILDRHKKCWVCRKPFDEEWQKLIYDYFYNPRIRRCVIPNSWIEIVCQECSNNKTLPRFYMTKYIVRCGYCNFEWEGFSPLKNHNFPVLSICDKDECVAKFYE